ncbi:hypothetical protein AgCh_021776 [Apium graveolens]
MPRLSSFHLVLGNKNPWRPEESLVPKQELTLILHQPLAPPPPPPPPRPSDYSRDNHQALPTNNIYWLMVSGMVIPVTLYPLKDIGSCSMLTSVASGGGEFDGGDGDLRVFGFEDEEVDGGDRCGDEEEEEKGDYARREVCMAAARFGSSWLVHG